MQKNKIIIILGPTSIGKSEFSMNFIDGSSEIISADAFQIYKEFNIGTAKVSQTVLKKIPHHLIDIKEATESYSAYDFCKDTNFIINQQPKKRFIIVGGTALYLHAFLNQYHFAEFTTADQNIKDYWTNIMNKKGVYFLWTLLNKIDPDLAKNTHPNHKSKILRALEIYESSGIKPSLIESKLKKQREDVSIIGLNCSREKLYTQINKRVDKMIQEGWIDEVKYLITKHPISAQAFKAIGYQEIIDYLHDKVSKKTMIETIKQKTRNFSKRQLTWFKKFEGVHWKSR